MDATGSREKTETPHLLAAFKARMTLYLHYIAEMLLKLENGR